jgi:hypothetical protein
MGMVLRPFCTSNIGRQLKNGPTVESIHLYRLVKMLSGGN